MSGGGLSEALHAEVGEAVQHEGAVGHAVQDVTEMEAGLEAMSGQCSPAAAAFGEQLLDLRLTGSLPEPRKPAGKTVVFKEKYYFLVGFDEGTDRFTSTIRQVHNTRIPPIFLKLCAYCIQFGMYEDSDSFAAFQ